MWKWAGIGGFQEINFAIKGLIIICMQTVHSQLCYVAVANSIHPKTNQPINSLYNKLYLPWCLHTRGYTLVQEESNVDLGMVAT